MKEIREELLFRGCKAIVNRENNEGCWVGGKIPEVFQKIRDEYYPNIEQEDGSWIHTMIYVVEMSAVKYTHRTMSIELLWDI